MQYGVAFCQEKSYTYEMNRLQRQKAIHNVLEGIRKTEQCPHHVKGAISIIFYPSDKSWILSCEETALPDMTPRSDGKCFWHIHFDPTDWA